MEKKHKRNFIGTIVSAKMQKTVVVRVDRVTMHPMYHKRVKISKRFKAHYDNGSYSVGDKVTIEEGRPLSKEVRWIIRSKA
ncbi:MAG: 30S ribosomal protein S17 [Candidatus Brennerbacteria bacterium CG11_big_fil_rev_8_21_14_0_20_43_10]|uniref:Small ribosomal subunit protein uS17 n=3 Tax=Candidatus Brenneribacteriota TaxID=1817902 RepID=A0A2M8C353_9BACT|nr:MAG: 30S ribosomal protein S17 [Parcubacteria group bacterium CG1_02_44_31]PIP50443.1 MAG: 30S ribosomal protein S17 [Candidatus Brennerbacteria bacterium CG23_combo_of_CG06-09_8_20_14_all_44_41]PIR26163.1 MAG: 30S ribosomal protein S17 [Candidatus Brennerbacteria bacterium CG11_big_fil_rev_8_21_14_0_20_43_10]PIX28752.1 MAG: 30S ribosomal protein S17 [Candidatus Brennerbacteria bacterium CG_4_8_14_3_um_filter_43_14]PJA19864.1 MAG: 30S ribosomal protein S17 [Candidatus Brennerbacteria bacteri